MRKLRRIRTQTRAFQQSSQQLRARCRRRVTKANGHRLSCLPSSPRHDPVDSDWHGYHEREQHQSSDGRTQLTTHQCRRQPLIPSPLQANIERATAHIRGNNRRRSNRPGPLKTCKFPTACTTMKEIRKTDLKLFAGKKRGIDPLDDGP